MPGRVLSFEQVGHVRPHTEPSDRESEVQIDLEVVRVAGSAATTPVRIAATREPDMRSNRARWVIRPASWARSSTGTAPGAIRPTVAAARRTALSSIEVAMAFGVGLGSVGLSGAIAAAPGHEFSEDLAVELGASHDVLRVEHQRRVRGDHLGVEFVVVDEYHDHVGGAQ